MEVKRSYDGEPLFARFGHKVKVLSDSFGQKKYLIAVGAVGTAYYLVHADCLSDAIDFIVDIDGDNVPGFFADEEATASYWDDTDPEHDYYAQDYYFPAGNAGELFTNEIVIIAEGTSHGYR